MLAKKISEKLERNEVSFGGWVSLGHESIAEIFALAGFDWVVVETEHTAIDNSEVLRMIMAIDGRGCVPLVRTAGIDPLQAKAVLDSGAAGIFFPMVNCKEDAIRCVEAVKYPPIGKRGVGLARAHHYGASFANYVEQANDTTLVIVQIEHIDAVQKIDEILSVEGIDITYIGPYDLSMSMGLPGKIEHGEVQKAMDRVLKATLAHNKTAGIHLLHPHRAIALVKEHVDKGYRFITLGSDLVILNETSRELLSKCKEQVR